LGRERFWVSGLVAALNAFLPVLDEMMGGGLVTLEKAKVIRYQDQGKG
jgi:PII-like signaling protein